MADRIRSSPWLAKLLGGALFLLLVGVGGWALLQASGVVAPPGQEPTAIGHVSGVYGSVRKSVIGQEHGTRLENGGSTLVSLRAGERLQTAERSGAEILFFGGGSFRLAPESVVQVEEGRADPKDPTQQSVIFRLVFGQAYLRVPRESPGGGNSSGEYLVPPLREKESFFSGVLDREDSWFQAPALLNPPTVEFPLGEAEIAVENQTESFRWKEVQGEESDPVVGYELSIRPAFRYPVEEGARKYQVFTVKAPELPLARVGGGGVFLWTVRAITAGGARGPASTHRWVELKFPKVLVAPTVKKPKVE